jgi:hypothetical protein
MLIHIERLTSFSDFLKSVVGLVVQLDYPHSRWLRTSSTPVINLRYPGPLVLTIFDDLHRLPIVSFSLKFGYWRCRTGI